MAMQEMTHRGGRTPTMAVILVLHGKAVELDGFESSYAKAGKICAIIGIVIGVIYLILTILAVVFSMSVGGLSTMLRA